MQKLWFRTVKSLQQRCDVLGNSWAFIYLLECRQRVCRFTKSQLQLQSHCCTQPIVLLPLATAKDDQAVSHWRLMPQGPSCMLLLAVNWTAAIVYLQVSAANCYKGCKWSRMLPLVLSQKPEDQRIWRLFYAIFTGCRFNTGSRLRQQFRSTSVCTAWLHSTFRSAHSGRLTVPRTRTNYGDRSFAVQGPRVWNSLPVEIRTPDILLATFRNRLKTFLFHL